MRSASISVQKTSCPASARQAPVTKPTYPQPMTQRRKNSSLLGNWGHRGLCGSPHKQPAQAEQHEFWLPAHNIPQQSRGFVAIDFTEGFAGRSIEQVDELGIIVLPKVVHGTANELVRVQLAAQRSQLSASAAAQNCLGYT